MLERLGREMRGANGVAMTALRTETLSSSGVVPTELLDELPVLASYVDRDLTYRFVNRTYERWFGVRRADIVGRTIGCIAPQEAMALWPVVSRVLAGEIVRIGYDVSLVSGARPVETVFVPHRDVMGQVVGFFYLCEDLTTKRTGAAAVEGSLDGLADGFIRLDADWRILALNSAAERFYGVERGVVLGLHVDKVWPSASETASGALVARVMKTRVPERAELQSVGAPGKSFLLDVVPLADGGVGIVIEDTTARRAMERALADSEARFKAVVAAVPGLVFIGSPEGDNLFVNRQFWDYTGLPEERLLGLGWIDTLHPEDQGRAAALWGAAVEAGTAYEAEYRFRGATGDHRWFLCRATPQRDESGRIVRWAGIAIDIQDRKAAEHQAAAKRELLQAVVDTSPDPIFVKNPDGRYRVANQAVLKAIRTEISDIVGLRDRDFLAEPIARALEANDQRVLSGETLVIEEITENLGPATRTFLTTKTPLRDGTGAIAGIVGIARDITDRKDGERHRDLLIGELNHRVKNVLTVVQSIAVQTLRDGADPVESRQALQARLHTLARAHDILVDHSWDAAPFLDIVERVLAPFRHGGPARFDLVGPELRLEPRVAVAMALILHELCTNAIKYGALSNESGRVELRWRVVRAEQGPVMKLTWREVGGPPVAAPTRRGFGSRLIERALHGELGGGAKLEFRSDGLVCHLELALPY